MPRNRNCAAFVEVDRKSSFFVITKNYQYVAIDKTYISTETSTFNVHVKEQINEIPRFDMDVRLHRTIFKHINANCHSSNI